MQVFFAISCLLAVLALSNGAPISPTSEQPRAEVEAQVAETAGQTRAVQDQATEQVASDGAATELKSTVTEENDTVIREKRTLWQHLRRLHARRNGCTGSVGCADNGCNTGCGGATPCQSNTVVLQQDVPVAQPVPVHVPVVQVVHQNVPVPQPVAVPVIKEVRVPVPVVVGPRGPCCSQPQPCCGQAPLPCSPCSG